MNRDERQAWKAHQAMWELELIGQPGIFSALMQMDALDIIGPAGYLAWRQKTGEHDPRQGA